MADLYVLVHGAWHTGAEMEAVAQHLRKDGHQVHCPTIAGNNAGDEEVAALGARSQHAIDQASGTG